MKWTPEAYREYGLKPSDDPRAIPFGPRDAASALDEAVRTRPDEEALVGRYSRFTFREYDRAINAAAAVLTEAGVTSGDRIGASGGNYPEIVIAFFAAMRLGAIWVGINRRLAPAEKRFLLKDAGVKVLLAEDEVIAELASSLDSTDVGSVISIEPSNAESQWNVALRRHENAPRPDVVIDPWAPAAIAYTSGTTGFPKGVVHSQHNIMLVPAVNQTVADPIDTENQRYGTTLPLTILNLMILGPVSAARANCPHVCMDRVDAAGIAEWVAAERITVTACAPTTAYDLLTRPDIDPDALRTLAKLSVGGATVPEKLPSLYYQRFGSLPRVGYGLTEAPTGVAASLEDGDPNAPPRPQGEIGPPMAQLEIQILDEQGNSVAQGESGEICVRAQQEGEFAHLYQPALGYWRNAEATEKLLRGGWLHTGDEGFIDQAGNLHIQDRRTDVIFRGGSNIYPAEVERVLRLDRRVVDCAVLGKADSRLGQVVAVFVQPIASALHDDTLQAGLEALCAENLARYKHPVEWHFIEEMPRNSAGKIVKPQLKERLEA